MKSNIAREIITIINYAILLLFFNNIKINLKKLKYLVKCIIYLHYLLFSASSISLFFLSFSANDIYFPCSSILIVVFILIFIPIARNNDNNSPPEIFRFISPLLISSIILCIIALVSEGN